MGCSSSKEAPTSDRAEAAEEKKIDDSAAAVEQKPTPTAMSFAIMRNAHEVIRGAMRDIQVAIDKNALTQEVSQLFKDLTACIHVHAVLEEEGLFKLFNSKFDGAAEKAGLHGLHEEAHDLEGKVSNALDRAEGAAGIADDFKAWADHHEDHMAQEEKVMMPLTRQVGDTPAARAQVCHEHVIMAALKVIDIAAFDEFLAYCMRMLEKHSDGKPRARVFAHGLQHASTPEQWARWLPIVQANLSPALFESINLECQLDSPGKIQAS